MELEPGEPAAGATCAFTPGQLLDRLVQCSHRMASRSLVVAIDGRGGAGKSTLAAALATARPGTALIHSDDVAWHHSYFGWGAILEEYVLRPILQGEDVDFRPRAWVEHGRPGSIIVPRSADIVVLEGTGVLQERLRPLIDASVWVQVDRRDAARRLLERDGDDPGHLAFVADWNREERVFLERHRPWEHATLIVVSPGTPGAGGEPFLQVAPGASATD